MTIQTIDIDKIDATGRLRALNPAWVEAMAREMIEGATLPPVEVIEMAPDAYRLVTGAHRLAATREAGRHAIEARVWPASAFADESDIKLKEVQENVLRFELTALDRAVAIAEWRRVYEETKKTTPRGRPRKDENFAGPSNFSDRFSVAAAKAVGISERTVYIALEIASIPKVLRMLLSTHPIADQQAELLAIARNSPERQKAIVDLLLDPDADVRSVAEAVATIDELPAPPRAAPWERVSDRFARLKEAQQYAFFEAHYDAIALWLTKRAAGASADRR